VPAPAVIPAPKAYTKIAVVKTLVVYIRDAVCMFQIISSCRLSRSRAGSDLV
jgi:hypothetical protein